MIKVEELEFTYPGMDNPAIKKISFEIAQGNVFGFLGPSGAGKSTVQKILFKLLSNYRGSVKIGGKEVRDWDKSFYQRIGVGFELPNHYLKLSAMENLRFFAGFYEKTADLTKLLQMVGLEKDANKKVSDFSKGMKMRLNFVRALIHDPEILFLDEPTSGLDPVNARILKDIILHLKSKGKTIFITTHNMHDADELCDTVAFLTEGSIQAMDTPTKLKQRFSERIIELQLAGDSQIRQFNLDGIGKNRAFLQLIADNDIGSLHTQEVSLDDVFIKVTGKTLV